MLRADGLQSAIIIKRNELVTVFSVTDGFEIKTTARARSEARLGDVIELRTEGSKRGFRGRVDGAGRVVALTGPEHGEPPRTGRDEQDVASER